MLKKAISLSVTLLVLSGCSSNEQMTQMSSKIDNLASQVERLSKDVADLREGQDSNRRAAIAAQDAADDAKKAVEKINEKVDNVVASYKK